MLKSKISILLSALAVLLLIGMQSAKAEEGHVVVHTNPAQAFVYADGNPMVDAAHHFLILEPGEHKIHVLNYGYKPEERTVTVESHKTTVIEVTLEAIPGTVSGPWACITVEHADRDAVLLNGKEAPFFVGHGDEFNNEWGWQQELVVPPGHYEVTVVRGDPEFWTVPVDLEAGKRVVIDAFKGVRKTVDWSRGAKLGTIPRFTAGTASARVAVEKVTGTFNSSSTQLNCGDSTHLTWSSTGAPLVTLNGTPVASSGDQTVTPMQTTDYKFTAAGPGGVYNSDANIAVNSAIAASISVSPAEVRYHKVADKVDQAATATLTWAAPNATTVSVDTVEGAGPTGSHDVQITPTKTTPGPIDETATYTLHASNACGVSETRTATLHITGSIDQSVVNEATLETKLSLNSIYFPTNLPTIADPSKGIVPSQQNRLDEIVGNFKDYLTVRPEAKLILQAHADLRGSVAFNKALSQRRADIVKNYLVEHGIPAASVETQAFGKDKNLTNKQVEDLNAKNPNVTAEARARVEKEILAFRMANNRRVDLHLSTTGQTSLQYFPYNSDDLNVLLGEEKPVAKKKMMTKKPAVK
jgi:outer membrane protein OmpA-like peptidoglycan-associated protein